MGGFQNASTTRPPRTQPRSASHVVADRLAIIRDDYIALIPDQRIIETRARQWTLTQRQLRTYLRLVKAKYARERTEADADFLRQLEGVVVANIQRARATEQRAADAGEFKAECAAQAQELRGVERLCAMRGLDAARKVEITKADPVAAMSPDERQARAKRHAARLVGAGQSLSERKAEGNA